MHGKQTAYKSSSGGRSSCPWMRSPASGLVASLANWRMGRKKTSKWRKEWRVKLLLSERHQILTKPDSNFRRGAAVSVECFKTIVQTNLQDAICALHCCPQYAKEQARFDMLVRCTVSQLHSKAGQFTNIACFFGFDASEGCQWSIVKSARATERDKFCAGASGFRHQEHCHCVQACSHLSGSRKGHRESCERVGLPANQLVLWSHADGEDGAPRLHSICRCLPHPSHHEVKWAESFSMSWCLHI